MKKEDLILMFGTAHRWREYGKASPDGRLKECVYSREIISELKPVMEDYGIRTLVDYEDLDLPKNMQTPNAKLERQRELGLRVNIVNEVCRQYGKQNVLYVSVHVDASPPVDNLWHEANGWSVRVCPKASEQSKLLANCLSDAAAAHGLKVLQPLPTQKYWVQSLKVLNDTECPAVLTENLFQNNVKDVAFLLSDEGRHVIERIHIEGILNAIKRL